MTFDEKFIDCPTIKKIAEFQETLDDIDKDGDGRISMDEYINDMYSTSGGDAESEPDWVKAERESFTKFRDENKVRLVFEKLSFCLFAPWLVFLWNRSLSWEIEKN